VPSEEAGYFRRTDNFPSLDREWGERQSGQALHRLELAVSPPAEKSFAGEVSPNGPLVQADV
jgi:hypothetical protein